MYIIDVSQSVEHDHPHALAFLMKDVTNVTEYFGKRGVRTMTTKELFNFVSDVLIPIDNFEDALNQVLFFHKRNYKQPTKYKNILPFNFNMFFSIKKKKSTPKSEFGFG